MPDEVDEYGIPIKKSQQQVDEFGIPVKKKRNWRLWFNSWRLDWNWRRWPIRVVRVSEWDDKEGEAG